MAMSNRQRTLIILIVVLAALFILAASIGGLELKPGTLFDIQKAQQPAGYSGFGNAGLIPTLLRGLLSLMLILLPFYFIYMLIDKQRRKRLLADLLGMALFAFLILEIGQLASQQKSTDQQPLGAPAVAVTSEPGLQGTPVEAPGAPSESTVTATALIFAGLAVAATALVLFWLARRYKPPPTEIARLADEAEVTIEALLAGKNLRDTILLCYRRMVEIVTKQRGLPREISVTPHEFEETLIGKGLPTVPVHDLTRLFEDVRYGGVGAGEEERQRAVSALRVIAAVCREPEHVP